MNKLTAFYYRISMEDKDMPIKQESDSIGNQRKLLHKYAEEHKLCSQSEIVEFIDDGYTGRNFERPAFQEMLNQCRKNRIGCIVVKDFSRIGRNYVEVGNLLEQVFPFLDVRVIAVSENYDSSTLLGSTGGMDVAFKNLVNNLYSKDLSQKIKSSASTKMKKGNFLSPYAIFGYRKSKQDIYRLEIDKESADIVRRIFMLVIDGVKRQKIAAMLNEENVPTPAIYKQKKGCTRDWALEGKKAGWNNSMIAKIIRDERYAGHMISSKTTYESLESRKKVYTDKEDWIVVRNTHEGIVSQEEFDLANANMQKTNQKKKKQASNGNNYSVITCPYCELRLRIGHDKEKTMYCPTGRVNIQEPCCHVKIKKDLIESILLEMVKKQAAVMFQEKELFKQKASSYTEKKDVMERNIYILEKEITNLERRKVERYEAYKEDRISRDEFRSTKMEIDSKLLEMQEKLRELQSKRRSNKIKAEEEKPDFNIIEFLELDKYDKSIMASLIKKAYVYDDSNIKVIWKFEHEHEYEKVVHKST